MGEYGEGRPLARGFGRRGRHPHAPLCPARGRAAVAWLDLDPVIVGRATVTVSETRPLDVAVVDLAVVEEVESVHAGAADVVVEVAGEWRGGWERGADRRGAHTRLIGAEVRRSCTVAFPI